MSALSLSVYAGLAAVLLITSVAQTAIWSRCDRRQQRAMTVLKVLLRRRW